MTSMLYRQRSGKSVILTDASANSGVRRSQNWRLLLTGWIVGVGRLGGIGTVFWRRWFGHFCNSGDGKCQSSYDWQKDYFIGHTFVKASDSCLY